MKFKASVVLSFIFLIPFLFNQCEQQKAEWQGIVEEVDGVTHVKNPLESLYDSEVLVLEEELTIGGEGSREEYLFYSLGQLVVDARGYIFARDHRAKHIKVFTGNGEYVTTIGREGNGPGEFDVPVQMDIHQNELVVHDGGNRRITFFSLDGDYKRSISTAKYWMSQMKIDSKGNIFCIVTVNRNGKQRKELQKFDSNLNYISTFNYFELPADKLVSFFMAGPSFLITRDDFIVYGCPEKNYEIKFYNHKGILLKKIQKEFVTTRVAQNEIEFATKNVPPGLNIFIPEYYSPYYQIIGYDKGMTIVFVRYKLIENINYFDIFNTEGKYLTTIKLTGKIKLTRSVWDKNKLYTIEEDDEGNLQIKRYKVTWNI